MAAFCVLLALSQVTQPQTSNSKSLEAISEIPRHRVG